MKVLTLFIITTCLIILNYTNCGDPPLARPSRLEIESVGMGAVSPVLAVRSPACLMCHAKVYGDMVVDFGFGEPFFFGLDKKENHIKDLYYGPFMSKHGTFGFSWNSASVFGNIYVPDVNLTDARVLKAYNHESTGNETAVRIPLYKFITSKFRDPVSGLVDYFIKPETSTDSQIPGLRGKVIPKKVVYIAAPTEDEIKSLLLRPQSRQKLVELGIAIYTGDSGDIISGMIAKQHSISRRFYATNKGTMKCMGDVIIDGTLFLNNLTLETDERGCRLYVSQSVFIQGRIRFQNAHPRGTIQISSARAIVMGTRALSSRFAEDATPFTTQGMRGAVTDEQELAWNMKIFDDRDKIDGLTNDAGPYRVRYAVNGNALGEVIAVMDDFDNREFVYLPGKPEIPGSECTWALEDAIRRGLPCVEDWAQSYKRKSIEFKNILLNAPKVHSRYYGRFNGVVIAEEAMFAVSHFEFKYNPVFEKVPILPLVGNRILSVSAE